MWALVIKICTLLLLSVDLLFTRPKSLHFASAVKWKPLRHRFEMVKLQGSPTAAEEKLPRNIMNIQDWGCMLNTQTAHDSKNPWRKLDSDKALIVQDPAFLNGTTIWINEWMAVGHAMYDIAMIQVFETMKVDRIVLQRDSCHENLCAGISTFDGWFMGYYMSIIEAFQPGIPVFLRYSFKDRQLVPVYLSSNFTTGYYEPISKASPIVLKQKTCFERVVSKRCPLCFYPGVGPTAAQKFKRAAYRIVSESQMKITDKPLPHHFNGSSPIVVTLAHRGIKATRRIDNIELLISTLARELPVPQFEIRVVNTSNPMWMFNEQIKLMAESQVVICEHGAFQSNAIYMRNGSLLIDMRGNYQHPEFAGYENIARMFGVYYKHVVTHNLLCHHGCLNFSVDEFEVHQAVQIVKDYALDRPFMHNSLNTSSVY